MTFSIKASCLSILGCKAVLFYVQHRFIAPCNCCLFCLRLLAYGGRVTRLTEPLTGHSLVDLGSRLPSLLLNDLSKHFVTDLKVKEERITASVEAITPKATKNDDLTVRSTVDCDCKQCNISIIFTGQFDSDRTAASRSR